MPNSLTALLNRIPQYYNKLIGKTSTPTNITIPVPGSPTPLLIGSDDIVSGSSNIVQLMSSVGFSADLLFQNIQTLKDISYVGDVPVNLFVGFEIGSFPVNTARTFDPSLPGNGFYTPTSIKLVSAPEVGIGKYYFLTSDSGYCAIEDMAGDLLQVIGSPGHGAGQLTNPVACAQDPVTNNFWVVDNGNNRIVVFDTSGAQVMIVSGPGGTDGLLTSPQSIVYDPNLLYMFVTDTTGRVQGFDMTGTWQLTFGKTGPAYQQITSGAGIDIDYYNRLYVCDLNNAVKVYTDAGVYLTEFAGPVNGESSVGLKYISLASQGAVPPPNQAFCVIGDVVNQNIQMYTVLLSPPTPTIIYINTYGEAGPAIGQWGSLTGVIADGTDGATVLDYTYHRITGFTGEITVPFATNFRPILPTQLEYCNQPGNIFNFANIYYSSLNWYIPLPANTQDVTYIILVNTGTVGFYCENVYFPPGYYQVFNYRPETLAWQPSYVNGFTTTTADPVLQITGTLSATDPINAVNVPGPVFPGFESPDLDPLGESYGVPRQITENDDIYKKRINMSVTGQKITPSSMIEQMRVIYGINNVRIYQWFAPSYGQMIAYVTGFTGWTGFYGDGTEVIPGSSPLDPTATQGPPNVFYMVVTGANLTLQNGVYPIGPSQQGQTPPQDWTFMDYPDNTIGIVGGVRHYGGFFRPNVGEPGYTLTSILQSYLNLMNANKAAGMYGVLVVVP